MSEIPEDVMKAAEQFVPKWALAGGDFDPWRKSIARAIMAEREDIEAKLSNPNAVHANMLWGTIAKPSVSQIIHLYGRALIEEVLAREQRRPRGPIHHE